MKLPRAWRNALLAAMCASAGGFSSATGETIQYDKYKPVPDELTINAGQCVQLKVYSNQFELQAIHYNGGELEFRLQRANVIGPQTMLTVGSVDGDKAGSLLGGSSSSLALTLEGAGTAVEIGENFQNASFDLVKIGDTVQEYGFLDVSIYNYWDTENVRTQRIAAGGWGETGSIGDNAKMRQTWLFHFTGSAVSFESAKRFANVVSESSTERLVRYYTADFGGGTMRDIQVTHVTNDAETTSLTTNRGTSFGVNCRAEHNTSGEETPSDGLSLDSTSVLTGFSNEQNAIDARVNKADGTIAWTAGRQVITLWLQGENTVSAVDGGLASSLNVDVLQIRKGGSLTMNGTDLSSDSIILAGESGSGASLAALNSRVDVGFLQTTGTNTSQGSLIAVGGGLMADLVDFQDANTSLVLHVGEKAASGTPLFAAGEVTEATSALISANSNGGGSAVSVTLDAAAAPSLINANLALVSIGGTTQEYGSITLNMAGNESTTRQLANGQWDQLSAPARSDGGILLYQYRDGELVFDSAFRTLSRQEDGSRSAVSQTTGEVGASAIGTGLAATAPLYATVTDTRVVQYGDEPDTTTITSVSDAAVQTDWAVTQATEVNAAGSAAGAIHVTSLEVGGTDTKLTIGNASLTTTGNMSIAASTSIAMGGQPLNVGGTLDLNGTLELTIGSATGSTSTLVSATTLTGTNTSSLTGTNLGDDNVSLALDTTSEGANLLGKQVTFVSIAGISQSYTSLTLADGSKIEFPKTTEPEERAAGTTEAASGMYDLQYTSADGSRLYLAYSFNGTTLTFGNSLTFIAPPEQSITTSTEDGGTQTTETSVKTDRVQQTIKAGDQPKVEVTLPNTADPTATAETVNVAENITVTGSLSIEATKVSKIETITTTDKNDNTTVTTNVSSDVATVTTLVVDQQVTLAQTQNQSTDPPAAARVTVDKTVVNTGQTLVLENTALQSGLSLDLQAGGTIDARGKDTKIVIGGRDTFNEGLDGKTTSEINGNIYLSEGAKLTAANIGSEGSQQAPEINITEATIHLGVTQNASGETAKTTGIVDGGSVNLRLTNVAIQGTGTVSNVQMNGGSLAAGHSPGQLTLANLHGNGTRMQVSIVGNQVQSGQHHAYTQETRSATAAPAISQFIIGENVHIDNGIFSVVWDGDTNPSSKLTEGTSFQFFDLGEQSITGNLTVDRSTLPKLADSSLTWDFSQLMTTGLATIVGIQYADPSRIANTLVSASDVVAGFGNMLYGHAREATARGSNFWVSGLGDFSDYASRGGRTGYTYNGAGYAVGYNWVNTCGHTLGLAFGQEFGKHEPKLGTAQFTPGSIDQDTVMFGLYGRCVAGKQSKRPIAIDAYAAYGRVDNNSRKTQIATGESATAQWNTDVFAAGLTASCEYRVCTETVLRPFVALEFVYASMDSFREGDGNSHASYTDGKYSNFSASAGLQVYRPYELRNGMVLTPSLSAAYVGDMMQNDGRVKAADAQGRALRGHSVSPSRNGFQGTAALDWRINSRWGMRAAYMIETRSGALDQDVNLGVNYTF